MTESFSTFVIKRVNKLTTDVICNRRVLFIPIDPNYGLPPQQEESEAAQRKRMVRRMVAQFEGSSEPEAAVYLEDADWDFDAACKQLQIDLEWEKSHPKTY